MKELREFNEVWDQKVLEFETHAAALQRTLAEKHEAEHQSYLAKVKAETEPRNPRWSKEYLNLRKIQGSLAKQKIYAEASRTKEEADRLEAKERAAWSERREARRR